MKEIIKKVKMWQCPLCDELHDTERQAEYCVDECWMNQCTEFPQEVEIVKKIVMPEREYILYLEKQEREKLAESARHPAQKRIIEVTQ